MKFKSCILILSLFSVGLTSCDHMSSDATQDIDENMNVLEVKESGYDLQVSLSDQMMTDETKFEFDRTFGHVEFVIDENFKFTLTQENTELAQIKKELKEEGLFTYKFYNYSDDELFYQGVLPDGTEMGYNFIRKTSVKEKSYIFRSNSQHEFSKEDIEKAKLILNKIS